MKLINVKTRKLEEFFDDAIPKYAILSHTWEHEEVSLQDLQNLRRAERMKGYAKIDETCLHAERHKLDYAWVDTCCIDKTSSAELSESINSMYQYYKRATVCYVYLTDTRQQRQHRTDFAQKLEPYLAECRWFTRGWTLQELLAPSVIQFYNREWEYLGSKDELVDPLSRITGISRDIVLGRRHVWQNPVAMRMSWAASRKTTRSEDMAYCLLGIFDINMPMLYGEGSKAFRRLQEEICKKDCDTSIFACDSLASTRSDHFDLFASSPAEFSGHGKATAWISRDGSSTTMTARGPRLTARNLFLVQVPGDTDRQKPDAPYADGVLRKAIVPKEIKLPHRDNGGTIRYVLRLDIGISTHDCGIFLEKIQTDLLRRDRNLPLALLPRGTRYEAEYQPEFTILDGRPAFHRPDSMHLGKDESFHIPFDRRVSITRIVPRPSWDFCRRLLFAPHVLAQIQAFQLEVRLGSTSASLWLLFDQRATSTGGIPKVRLLDSQKSRKVDRLLQSVLRYAKFRPCIWDELEVEGREIEALDDSVVVRINDRQHRIYVAIETQTVKENGISIRVFAARFHIK
ncbi:het domain protein [Colletotrichum sojae]|uniref:Het domain protein n=1 Tax=Colletotrichum sojae TaxID=2175907 RepID=A0A8H6JC17_9PEZI|nr:het domain protein [Colletotrichum sojae]